MTHYAMELNNGYFWIYDHPDNAEVKYVISTIEEHEQLLQKQKECELLEEQLEEVTERAQHFEDLNQNLLRISKERANQDRDVENKKTNDGYFVMSSKQVTERYEREMTPEEYEKKDDYFKETHLYEKSCKPYVTDTAIAWRTCIQTPYSIDLEYDNIADSIAEELIYQGVLYDLGCVLGASFDQNYRKGYKDGEEVNTLFRILFSADFNNGLWNVDVFTTMPLTFPDDKKMPAKNRNNKRTNSEKSNK